MSTDRLRWVIAAGIVLAVVFTYRQVLTCGFTHYDDDLYVTANVNIRNGLTAAALRWAFSSFYAANWHPVTWMSHMLDVQLYGMTATGHHFTSLLIHAASSVLLFLALARISGRIWPGVLVAGLFGLHPIHVESVAWIAERKDVLYGFFWNLGLWVYAGMHPRPPPWRRGLLALIFALGLMSKPMMVTFPCALMLMDFWPLGRLGAGGDGWRRCLAEKAELWLLAVLGCAVTLAAQSSAGVLHRLDSLSLAHRLANAVVSYAAYIRKGAWPAELSVFYPLGAIGRQELAVAAMVLGALTVAAIGLRRRYPFGLAGWLWFLGTLLPVIGMVQVGAQRMADRYTYIPLVGLYIVVAWGLDAWTRSKAPRRVAAIVAAAAMLTACGVATRAQVPVWRDGESLFRHARAVTADNSVVRNQLGYALQQRGKLEAALAHYRQAVRLDPSYPDANNNLGNLLAMRGDAEGAIGHYRAALRRAPNYAAAHYNLARVLTGQGELAAAAGAYRKALLCDPDMPAALYHLSWLLSTTADPGPANGSEALELAQRLMALTGPGQPLALDALAAAQAQTGDAAGALATARRALELARRYELPELAAAIEGRLAVYRAGGKLSGAREPLP